MGPTAPARIRDTGLGTQASGLCQARGHRTVKMFQSSLREAPRMGPALAERSSFVRLLRGQTRGCLIQTRKPETRRVSAKAHSWEEVRPGRPPVFLRRALWGARG